MPLMCSMLFGGSGKLISAMMALTVNLNLDIVPPWIGVLGETLGWDWSPVRST